MKLSIIRFDAIPIVLLTLIASLFIGYSVGQSAITYREIIVGVVGTALLITIVGGDKGLYYGFLIWIGLFFLGYRTIRLTDNWLLHPLILLAGAMFVSLVLHRVGLRERISWPLPRLALLFALFWVTGLVIGFQHNIPWDAMLAEATNFVVFFPILIVANHVLQEEQHWRTALIVFFAIATAIALLGIIEYVFPGIRTFFPGYIAADTTVTAGEYIEGGVSIFNRAGFVFWGQPSAAFVCAIGVAFAIPLASWTKSVALRFLILGSVLIQFAAIYLAGWRSLWAIMIVICILLPLSRKNWSIVLVMLIALIFAYQVIPDNVQIRVGSLFNAAQGDFQDTSALERYSRLSIALQQTIQNPFGMGWSAAGWVHSDFIQVAANLGILAGIAFLAWYVLTLIRLWFHYTQTKDAITTALLCSFAIVGSLFATQPIYVLPQLVAPCWFVWAMVEIKLRQATTRARQIQTGEVLIVNDAI